MGDLRSKGGDLFIVDNSDADWKVKQYLHEWADLATKFDIATGYFEIGALLALDGQWQKLEQLRILTGDQVSLRTRKALLEGVERAKKVLDISLEKEKEGNDFLRGVPAIVDAISDGKIKVRIYTKDKFHAKAYITHAKQAVIGAAALVGSSNFTYPGLTTNVELNIQIRREVEELQTWFETHWNQAEEISDEVLKVIERHVRDYTPFEVYAKALQEFFRGHELTVSEWELSGPKHGGSQMYAKLDRYQQEGYRALMKIAQQYGGAFLCDGVGLGKTFIGLMAIERLTMFERKRVALFVPKAARKPVWEKHLRKHLPQLYGDFSNLVAFNHTDLSREGDWVERFRRIAEQADAIVIDEAHHFRNPGIKGEGERKPSRYRKMLELCEGKQVYLLTATPINNKLIDLQHMIELFVPRRPDGKPQVDFFKDAPLGIHSLRGHFRKMENALERLLDLKRGTLDSSEVSLTEAEAILKDDTLFRALVVQRSRAYVRKSQEQHGESAAMFPVRATPQVVGYSVKKTYGRLLDLVEAAFSKEKALFTLGSYYPLYYYSGPRTDIDPLLEGRQKQVVSLIRTQFLKRFESSVKAFEVSCIFLLRKILAFQEVNSATKSERARLEKWCALHQELIDYAQESLRDYRSDADDDEDFITEEMLEGVEKLERDEYRISDLLADNYLDLDQICEFLEETQRFRATHDDKLAALKKLLKNEPLLKGQKVLIFSEYMHTARYLHSELTKSGFVDVDEVDSSDDRDRGEIITRFAPYYNDSSSAGLIQAGLEEIQILISTDVLSEGLNLQDATLMINYDLHWNPVRLMQRIGRVDRRMDPAVEKRIIADHPERAASRGKIHYWNFLPPDELDDLLKLYSKVSHKTLRISKVFGIEGRKLLKPEDDYEALKDFTHAYEGTTTTIEEMHLEYQRLLRDNPGLEERLNLLPGRVFSGKQHPTAGARAVFLCYALPAPRPTDPQNPSSEVIWAEDAGRTKWYLFDLESEIIVDEPAEIVTVIRSEPTTTRRRVIEDATLSEIRVKVEKHIKNSYLKQVQAPAWVKPVLKCWMELS
ncbi:MAG: helicase [candidate division Zixibacteria bacterium]|nr:helicase [candidate division Zixibacteria bacterium]